MDYNFLKDSIEKDNLVLPESTRIDKFLLKNNQEDIISAIDFLDSQEKFLYVHGFLGTGKRQFINYVTEFLDDDVIKLEYYCKEATVCDDILLKFSDLIDNLSISKAINLNAKITTLAYKFEQQLASIKKPFLIILHSFDDVLEENSDYIKELFSKIISNVNVKIVISTKGMNPSVLGDVSEDRKIFLKAFTKENFKDFLLSNQVIATDRAIEDFYKATRGYYYYAALTTKIVQAMEINLSEFMQKFNQSEMSFDSFLGMTYVNLLPSAIRNFFWFLRAVRHGLSLNSLAVFDIYDEFSINYLKTNLMIFQAGEMLYVQDYFLQKIDLSIPKKTEVKLHKYIITIYEKLLKESVKERSLLLSRQAMRAEIEYHGRCISELENKEHNQPEAQNTNDVEEKKQEKREVKNDIPATIASKLNQAIELVKDRKYTDAIELFLKIIDMEGLDLHSLLEARAKLAYLYKEIGEYKKAEHYYELVETYYKQHNELINLNYLYYDLTDLYFKMYKNERAIETIKKVIYSVDTPQSLMVTSCTLLGNIYAEMNIPEEAYSYYKKALESLDENVDENTLAELYFKFALANDDRGEQALAFEYYDKCIAIISKNPYRALAYSNMASCYYENENNDEALNCFNKAYEIEKNTNNYDGIYYTASHIAKILIKQKPKLAYDYLIEAKRSADFLNEAFYMIESAVALGDYYYYNPKNYSKALNEYFKALDIAQKSSFNVDMSKIEGRINDMRLRMDTEEFSEIERKYD